LSIEDLHFVEKASKAFNLDFDDAYQYATAEIYNLNLVSFDTDFDKTKRGRLTPEKIQ